MTDFLLILFLAFGAGIAVLLWARAVRKQSERQGSAARTWFRSAKKKDGPPKPPGSGGGPMEPP